MMKIKQPRVMVSRICCHGREGRYDIHKLLYYLERRHKFPLIQYLREQGRKLDGEGVVEECSDGCDEEEGADVYEEETRSQ